MYNNCDNISTSTSDLISPLLTGLINTSVGNWLVSLEAIFSFALSAFPAETRGRFVVIIIRRGASTMGHNNKYKKKGRGRRKYNEKEVEKKEGKCY